MKTYLFCLGLVVTAALPAQETPPVFTLNEAVTYALENATSVRNAEIDILDAEQEIKERLSAGLPQVNGSVDFLHYLKVPQVPLPEAFAMGDPDAPTSISFQLKNSLTGGINVRGMVFDGSYFVALRAARASRDYFGLQLEEARRRVRSQVTQSYFPVLLVATNVDILDRNIDNLEKISRETQAQYDAGFVEQLDVDRLQLSLNNLRSQRAKLLQQRENALRALKFTLNYPEDQPLEVSDDLERLEIEIEAAALSADIPYQQRSEVRLLDQTLALQDLNIELQRAAFLPTVNASLAGQYQFQGNSFSDGFWAPTVVFGLTAAVPIYDFGARSARVQRARLDKEQVLNQRDEVVRGIALEVRNARGTFTVARQNLTAARENLELAERIYETTQIKYREGVGSSIETVQAEQQLYESQAGYLNALYETLLAKEELFIALGRD